MDRINQIKGMDILSFDEMEKVKELAPILFELEDKCRELGLNHIELCSYKYNSEIHMFSSWYTGKKFDVATIEHYNDDLRIVKKFFDEDKCVRTLTWEGDN